MPYTLTSWDDAKVLQLQLPLTEDGYPSHTLDFHSAVLQGGS